jgi:hypothetical protein
MADFNEMNMRELQEAGRRLGVPVARTAAAMRLRLMAHVGGEEGGPRVAGPAVGAAPLIVDGPGVVREPFVPQDPVAALGGGLDLDAIVSSVGARGRLRSRLCDLADRFDGSPQEGESAKAAFLRECLAVTPVGGVSVGDMLAAAASDDLPLVVTVRELETMQVDLYRVTGVGSAGHGHGSDSVGGGPVNRR